MTVGVLLMAYGTPRQRSEIEAYYTDIRRGRPPSPEQLAELTGRYDAIGGLSPLAEITERQRRRLGEALGDGYVVTLGMKHSAPSIEDGVATLVAGGVERIVGLVLAPHYSAASVGDYLRRMSTAASDHGIPSIGIRSWADDPAFVEFCAGAVRAAMAEVPAGSLLVFTAHSLPQRVIDGGDGYVDELRSTARAVVALLGDDAPPWRIGWQSAGRTPEPWIGPDIAEVITELGESDAPGIVVAAVGFVADHLEVLYDLDIAAAAAARRAGISFARTRSMNDDAVVFDSLAERIREAAR